MEWKEKSSIAYVVERTEDTSGDAIVNAIAVICRDGILLVGALLVPTHGQHDGEASIADMTR